LDTIYLLNKIKNTITFVWIPSHVGIHGNEMADQLAKDAIQLPIIGSTVNPELSDVYRDINTHILNKWQMAWDNTTGNAIPRLVNPKVGLAPKYQHKNRKIETKITRLRLGQVLNNHYLHKIGVHPDGLCQTCGVTENIQHQLFECKSNLSVMIRQRCRLRDVPLTIQSVLSEPGCQKIIIELFKEHKYKN
jgi:hypothetical protein